MNYWNIRWVRITLLLPEIMKLNCKAFFQDTAAKGYEEISLSPTATRK